MACTGAASRAHNGGEAGEGTKGRVRGCAPWGEYKRGGRKREAGAGEEERKAQRGEKYRRGVVV